jgi:hypothetical protein
MGTSSLNETMAEHALLPIDGAVMYECQSGVLSIIDTVKARTMLYIERKKKKFVVYGKIKFVCFEIFSYHSNLLLGFPNQQKSSLPAVSVKKQHYL